MQQLFGWIRYFNRLGLVTLGLLPKQTSSSLFEHLLTLPDSVVVCHLIFRTGTLHHGQEGIMAVRGNDDVHLTSSDLVQTKALLGLQAFDIFGKASELLVQLIRTVTGAESPCAGSLPSSGPA